jgi:kinesin family protein 2/24
MPSIPLVSELGAKAAHFQGLLNAVSVSEQFLAKCSPALPASELFTAADSRVFVRARPVIPFDNTPATDQPCIACGAGKRDAIFLAPKLSVSGVTSVEATRVPLDGCFVGSADTTEVVYAHSCAPLVELAVTGASASVICYGQTGSGKTYTTSGILALMANDIRPYFDSYAFGMTVVEIQASVNLDLLTGAPVQVVEDASGEIQVLGSREVEIVSTAQLLSLLQQAAAARATKATGRNETSSRSHMVVKLTARSKASLWAKPGVLFVADLAGSENTADSATHDKTRQMEAKFINSSLMTLKDCIRARALASSSTSHLHIPYRQSPLTLLLRDCFELAVKRPTKTVVIACVSPLLRDVRHTANTLRYAQLLAVAPPPTVIAADQDDPNGWSREQALQFIATAMSRGRIKDPELVLPDGDGRALVHIPEAELIGRIIQTHSNITEKSAKMMYDILWKAVIDARTRSRKTVTSAKARAPAVNRWGEKENEAVRQEPPKVASAVTRMANRPPMVFD